MSVSAKRVNTPPKAIVQPVSQTVNLPTTKAIIDGSGSQDDNTDLKFKWEILNGPVNYQHELPSEPTLTLADLVSNPTLSHFSRLFKSLFFPKLRIYTVFTHEWHRLIFYPPMPERIERKKAFEFCWVQTRPAHFESEHSVR